MPRWLIPTRTGGILAVARSLGIDRVAEGAATVRGWSGESGDTRRVGADIRKFRSSVRRRGFFDIDERKSPCC